MQRALMLIIGVLFAASVCANQIDDNCPNLTYKHAPVAAADQYICHTEYAVALSYKTRNPVYTTELLAADHTGDELRTNDFKPDPEVPMQYAVRPSEYKGQMCHGDRCDKGHMTPDQDFSACGVCVHESFYMSNMVPQNSRNNEIIWKYMEVKIRNYVAENSATVYVITGPVYGNKPDHIGGGIMVPDSLFKIVIDESTGKSIAFLMPNADIPTDRLPDYVVSIASVEAATGIVFDSSLDKHAIGALKVLQ